ncbi:MAG: Ig domain-containing protein [Legionellaceae bacterium]|nr:Ig domain-containing protein [Legionellaceae bacterium]
MKKYLTYLSFFLSFFLFLIITCQNVSAGTGPLFIITESGVSGNANVTLCLNAKGPLSCQKYNVSSLTLAINTSIPNRTYPNVGIKVNGSAYKIANPGVECTQLSNGYCLFSTSGSSAQTINLSSTEDLSISPTTLPDGEIGTIYSQTVTASNGLAPYTYSISSGSLPAGLSINASTGVISGTPTTENTYQFTVTATDTVSDSVSRSYSVEITTPAILGALGVCTGGASARLDCTGNSGITGNYTTTAGNCSSTYVSGDALMIIVGTCAGRGTRFELNAPTNTTTPVCGGALLQDSRVQNVYAAVGATGSLIGCQVALCTDENCTTQTAPSAVITS